MRNVIQPKDSITSAHLEPYLHLIQKDSIVIINTGWGHKRGFSTLYYHDWPYLSGEGACWLRDLGVKGVGRDAMSLGGWYEGTGAPCPEALLSPGIWMLEELFFPDELMEYKNCYLMAFPVKFKGFYGAPCRAVAAISE